MNSKSIFFILLLLSFFTKIYCQYPEDFSSIEQLTYLQETSEEEEVFIGSYFHNVILSETRDFRNGINLNLKNLFDPATISEAECIITPNSYSTTHNDDEPWDNDNYGNLYYPTSYFLTNGKCIESDILNFNLSTVLTADDIEMAKIYDLTYYFYFWIQKPQDCKIVFSCEGGIGERIILEQPDEGLFQIYLKYKPSNNEFSSNTLPPFTCQSLQKISFKSSDNSNNIYFHRLKLSVLISKEKITKSNCNNSTKCPYSYYCEEYTGECKKCLGMFSQCSDRKTGISCSRFSKGWESVSPETVQKECKEEYYNLQYLDEMSYDINPPIISNAATISFWLFTTKDFNEPSNPNIYHITLEDFFVVTIIPGKSQYIIYVTGYEMYHEAYGTILKDLKTKEEFKKIIGEFPYKNWKIKKEVVKINRWINVFVSFNKNFLRLSMQIFYQKRDDANYGSLPIDTHMITEGLNGEYIYNNENNIKSSRLHFKKYYRNSDKTHLNIKIYNNEIGVYFRKLYIFATELLKGQTENLFGFQYIEFEKIFKVDNSYLPELILAVPFENITQSGSDENKYFVEYYIYDMTKIYNNRNKKYLTITPGNLDNLLYTYAPGLYRLNLISEQKKEFVNVLLAQDDLTCPNPNDYCYSNNLNGIKPYACTSGFVIDPENYRSCTPASSSRKKKIGTWNKC